MRRVIIVGGGAAGLAAAYTLKKRGINPILFEADDHVGGRLAGEIIDGFHIDTGADFFCSSYDTAFRICEELDLQLIRSKMKLGWFKNGRWVTSTPGLSPANLIRNLPAAAALGLLSPKVALTAFKLFKEIFRQSEYLNFSSKSRISELDDDENFGEYLARIGIPESVQTTFRGFLEMTMGQVERSGHAYMRTYLAEMLIKADKLYVPEKGAGALAHALADACGDNINVSAPVDRIVIQDGATTGVRVNGDTIEADAVICAVPPTQALNIISDLPTDIQNTLGNITYSTGCRVVIGLDRPPLPEGWNGALHPEDDTPLMLDRSLNLPSITPPGKSTLDLLVGRERAKELIKLDDDEIKRQMLRDARKNPPPGSALPSDHEVTFTRVYRWKEAVCMGPPGMFIAVADARRNLSENVTNLFLAGDYTKTPSVNGALASGVEAAEQVANQLTSA